MNTTLKMLLGGLVLLSQTIGAGLARADDVKAGDLVISKVWSRATPGGAKVAAGYLTIENKGTAADRLIGGSTSIAGKLEAHEMITKNGVMTMHPIAQSSFAVWRALRRSSSISGLNAFFLSGRFSTATITLPFVETSRWSIGVIHWYNLSASANFPAFIRS